MGYIRIWLSSVCMALLVCVLLSSHAFAADSEKEKEAAQQILEDYKGKLKPKYFHFASEEEFAEATVGISVPVYRMDIAKVANDRDNLSDSFNDTNLVEFTINLKGKTVTRMTLKKNGDTFSKFGFGGNGDALAKGLAALPKQARPNVKLVKLGPAEFLYAEANQQAWFVYISRTPLDGIESQKLYKADVIAPKLQLIAKRMLETADSDGGIGTGYEREKTKSSSDTPRLFMLVAGIVVLTGAFGIRFYKKRH